MRVVKIAVILLAVVFVAIQLVPVERTNPPVQGEIEAPPAVAAVLERSCYDCHSNETHWPWYGYVAPVSWLVAEDVEHGREHLNFSTWESVPADDRAHLLEELIEEVEKGAMPLPKYLRLHPGAELSAADLETLIQWAGPLAEEHDGGEDHAGGEGGEEGDGHGDHDHADHEHGDDGP